MFEIWLSSITEVNIYTEGIYECTNSILLLYLLCVLPLWFSSSGEFPYLCTQNMAAGMTLFNTIYIYIYFRNVQTFKIRTDIPPSLNTIVLFVLKLFHICSSFIFGCLKLCFQNVCMEFNNTSSALCHQF